MALTAYETATRQLLQNPAAPTQLYSTANLDTWINSGRGQLAAESESVRAIGTLTTTAGNRVYNFSSIAGLSASIRSVLHVRRITYNIASGQRWITPRSWSYFDYYFINNPVPSSGSPKQWSQFGQSVLGSIYIDPPPDQVYTLNCDCVCIPIDLVDDTTPELIPYPFTDAVAYFAAYLAYLSAQSPARQADALRMFSLYQEFTNRARQFSNPDVLKGIYLQSSDPTMAAKLGLQPKQGAA